MNSWIDAWTDFISQPFGLVGAICIMAAVTAINSQWLTDRFAADSRRSRLVFNGLNLIGGASLLINAVIRDEIVWLVLEFYFIAIAIKGLMQIPPPATEQPA